MKRSGPGRKPSVKSLERNDRAEHPLTLGQSLECYRFPQQRTAEVDKEDVRQTRAQAITAAAHKLARIFYTIVNTGKDYDESVLAVADARQKSRDEANLRKHARDLGFQLVPV